MVPISLSELDELDLRILMAIQDPNIVDYRNLATAVQSTKSTVYNRVQLLRDRGFLKKQFASINLDKMNFSGIAFITIDCEPAEIDQIVDNLKKEDEVFLIGRTLGKFDVVLLAVTPSLAKLGLFVDKKIKTLQGVQKDEITISTFHQIDKYAEKFQLNEKM